MFRLVIKEKIKGINEWVITLLIIMINLLVVIIAFNLLSKMIQVITSEWFVKEQASLASSKPGYEDKTYLILLCGLVMTLVVCIATVVLMYFIIKGYILKKQSHIALLMALGYKKTDCIYYMDVFSIIDILITILMSCILSSIIWAFLVKIDLLKELFDNCNVSYNLNYTYLIIAIFILLVLYCIMNRKLFKKLEAVSLKASMLNED